MLPPGVDNKPRPGVLVPRLGVLAPLDNTTRLQILYLY